MWVCLGGCERRAEARGRRGCEWQRLFMWRGSFHVRRAVPAMWRRLISSTREGALDFLRVDKIKRLRADKIKRFHVGALGLFHAMEALGLFHAKQGAWPEGRGSCHATLPREQSTWMDPRLSRVRLACAGPLPSALPTCAFATTSHPFPFPCLSLLPRCYPLAHPPRPFPPPQAFPERRATHRTPSLLHIMRPARILSQVVRPRRTHPAFPRLCGLSVPSLPLPYLSLACPSPKNSSSTLRTPARMD